MKQKLIAAAVAGAFVAPAAFAQSSSVQIYGLLNAEYGFHSAPDTAAGASRSSVDALNSGASRIGLKGEEKLSGGMSAFFQCESDIRFLGGGTTAAGSWCDRNSAVGLKGGFGSVYVGIWDSPIKRVSGLTRITNETGWLGSQQMTLGNAGAFNRSFSTRNSNSVNYDTPNFGGFSASAQYTVQSARISNVTPTPEGREIGLSGQYVQGPLIAVLGYSKRDDSASPGGASQLSSTTTTTYVTGSEDEAWMIGAAYTFGPVKVGLSYVDAEYANNGNPTTVGKTSRKSWNLAADWRLGGPHMVRFGYADAGDAKNSATGAGANTGAKQYQIGYHNMMSKRTSASLSYVRISNDSAGTYTLTSTSTTATSTVPGGATSVRAGDSSSALVLGINHTF